MRTDSKLENASSVKQWINGRLAVPGLASDLRAALEQLSAAIDAQERPREVFLSVVIRTQAKRWEQLQDSLLSLAAQTDQDFEVLLMLHNVTDAVSQHVDELVSSYPKSFAQKVRIARVEGGNRTRPLVDAVPRTRGAYLAFYDDDDLLMANWVETFREAARAQPGVVVRTITATQHNRAEEWPGGLQGQRSIRAAAADYPRTFNFVDHLERNLTPFMSVAFPAEFFDLWGENFDESLTVCEDWDILVRAVALLGVTSVPTLTAIYRQWQAASTSYTLHSRDEWSEVEARVAQKFDSQPLLAPTGTQTDVVSSRKRFRKIERELSQQFSDISQSTSWRITAPLRRAVTKVRDLRQRNK